jgi:carbonic anhydrase/acetyltransferase-like protein (isoleucine patch superfamily)
MKPEIHKSTFIDKNSVIIGNVKIGKNCGVYPNATIRGDQNLIVIGDGSNIQDCCVIHCDETYGVKIGKNVSIGHCAMIHGATIEDDCLIGIHSTILNGSKIKSGSIIGAGAVIMEGEIIPENSLVVGIPGKVIEQNPEFRKKAKENAETYQKLSKNHLEGKYEHFKT